MGLIDNVNVNVGGNGNIIDTLSTYVTKVLKPNIVDGENVLTQDMMSAANTKYVIKYNFNLIENIIVPADCLLEFDGGSIIGEYTITCQDTIFIFVQNEDDVFVGVTLDGTFKKRSGSYNDLENKPVIPVIPANVSAFNNDANYQVVTAGTTEERPTNVIVGFCYFDTTLNYPIWYKGEDTWVDATGTTV